MGSCTSVETRVGPTTSTASCRLASLALVLAFSACPNILRMRSSICMLRCSRTGLCREACGAEDSPALWPSNFWLHATFLNAAGGHGHAMFHSSTCIYQLHQIMIGACKPAQRACSNAMPSQYQNPSRDFRLHAREPLHKGCNSFKEGSMHAGWESVCDPKRGGTIQCWSAALQD